MAQWQADVLREAVEHQRNMLIGGTTGCGKTTMVNALLAVMAEANERIVTIEDTPELQCPAANTVRLFTRPGIVTMRELVQDTLRMRPDKIIIGETRGAECADAIDAWGTGHPGGVTTVHATSATGILPRLESLVRQANVPRDVARDLIAGATPLLVYIERTPQGRKLKEIVEITGVQHGEYVMRRSEG
jgi:type IV secretion system protein VirB11